MFKKWLRSEEAKGFSKAYKEALQPPVLRGGVLAYRQRQQQQRHQREEGKEKDQQAEAQEIQKGKGEEPLRGALNKGVQAEAERECEQHKLDIAADARCKKENKQGTKFVAAGRKVGNTVAVLKSADKSQKKKLRKKNQASLATLKGENQATCGKEKQTLQTKKQKQEHTNQEAAHLKQREHQQESSYQAPGSRQQTQQQHVLEQPNAHGEVISPIEETKRKGHLNEEDLTIETPFALMTAFEAERDFERNLEARLSARLESLLAAREEERQRLLVAASKFVPENVTDKCQPSSDNALATAVEHEPNSGGGGDYTTLSGVTAIQGTNSVNTETQPNERQVPQEQDGLAPDSGNADAERPRVSTKEQESGAIIGTVQSKKDEIRPVQSLDEEDHHKATEGVDSKSLSADERTAGSAADSLPPADADARAPLDGGAASIIAERSQTEKEKLNRKPAAEDAVEMTEGDATAKQGDGGRFLHAGKDIPQFEAFCAKEKAFQAEIEVVEELRLQAKLAVQSIPQLPPRLPLDGIVLVGPIQNSLLAPEELLLQLLAGCPSLKIESLDILVGHPVKKVPLELRTEEPTELLSRSVLPVKQEGKLAEEAKEAKVAPTLAPPLDAAADSARTATVEQTIPNNSTSRLESVQQPQGLYEVIWPESILTYPRKLVPIETRKKRTSAGVELADERARQRDSGNTGSTGREAFLTRRKREREEGSREAASPPKEMHHQPQSGSRQKEDIEFVKSAACSSDSAVKLAATAVDSKEEVKEGGRIPIEEDGPSGAQNSVNLSTRHQRSSTVEAMPTLMCNGSGAAVPAGGDTGPQVLRTIQSSSGVPKPTLLHTLQNLPRIGTLEVIKEEAEEYLEEDDSPSCAGFSGVAQPAARLLEGESAASTSIGGDQPGSSNHTSLAIPEGISVEKRRRTEDATRILEEGAQDVVASTASAESYPGTLTSMGATNLEQQKISPSAEHHENDSGNVLSAVETAAATASPGGGTGTGIEGSTFGDSEEKESSHLLNKENSGKEGWHPARVCPEQAASERAKIPGRCSAVSGRIKASEISLNDLRRKGDGLFSQRELALRLLDYRDEDDLRLCYVARIQCADEASFVYLLSHRFQRMRQQPIHVYPSFCYPLLFQRGKRMDREILTHATAMVLAANATPPVTAVVQALAAARKGEHHDFLWLLGCRLGAARRGKSSMWRNPGRGDVGEQPALLEGQDLTVRWLGSAARASTLDMLLPPLPSRPVSMGNSRSRNRGRSPFEGLHIEAVSAGPCFYEEVGSERGGALGRLTPIPPFAIKEPPGKQMERPSFSSKFALLGAAPKLNAKSFASPLSPFTQPRCRMPGGHDVQDPGCCWPVFVPFGVRGGGEEHRYSSQPRPPWYDRGNLLLEEAEAPPFPAFYFTDAARAATQGRRMRNPGAATRSCVPAATRVPHGLLSPPLPGSALAAAALKMRRGTVNRSNLAAHRRDAWLLTLRSRTLSAGSGAAGALPSLFHRSESTIPFCLGNEEIPGGLGVGAKNIFGGRLLGRAREMSVAEGGGGGRGVMQNEGQTSAFPRVAAGMRQQRGFPIARVSRIRLPSPAPSLSAFFLRSPLPARNDIQVGKTGPINPDNACYVGMGKDNPRNECLGETASGATMEMQQQGGGTPAVWMSGVFDSCSGMLDESDTLNRPAAGSGIYNSLEGGTGSGGGGDAADSMNGRVPANPLHVWGEVASQTDTRAGHSTHLFETQVPGGAGRRQGLNRGPRNAQAANMRAELHRGERRYMSQQIAVTQPRNLAAAQRAPPPPPPLPGDSEVCGRETRRDTQGSWGGSRNLMSAQHSSTCGENWPGDNAGLRGSEQQKHHQQLQQCQRQQRATGAIASAAGDRKGRVSGWTSESNHGAGGGREPQIHEMWGPRYQSLGGGESETTGGTAGDAGTLACGRWQQQQGGQLSARVRMHQGGAWEGAFRKEEREAARNTWSQPQSREGAGRSSNRGGDTPGWPAPYSGKLIHGVSPQHQLQAQQQQGVRSNHALEGGGTFGGTVDWGNLGNTTVSNAAARAAAASMAGKQLPQPGNFGCAGGAAEVWPLEGSTWNLPIGSSARGLKCGGNSGTSGGGAEYPHGREDTSQHRPYPGEGTGGTRSSNIDSATTGRQLVSEAGGTNSGAAAGTTWRGNKKTVGICEQQKQQHGYFCTDQEQRVHCSTAGGSNTGGATAAVAGAGFAPEDTGGESGLLPAAEEAYNSGANARGAAHVSGSTQAYGGPAPPVAPPSGEASGRGKSLTPGSAYPPSFSVGPPVQGQRAADGGTVHMRDGYTFPPSSGAVGAGRDPAGFGAEGGQLQSGTVADTGKRGGAAQDLALYGGGKGGTAPDRLPQHLYNAGIAEYSVIKHGGPGTDSWAQESGKANCTRRGPTPAGGRGGYGRSRTAGAEMSLPSAEGAPPGSDNSLPPYNEYSLAGRGSVAVPGKNLSSIAADPGGTSYAPRGSGVAGESYGSGSAQTAPRGGAPPPGKAYDEGAITGLQTQVALRPAAAGVGELGLAPGMGTATDAQQQFAMRGGGTQERCQPAEQSNQGRRDTVPGVSKVVGASAGGAGAGGPDGRRLVQRNDRRFYSVPRSALPASEGSAMQRAHVAPPPVPPSPSGAPQWTIQRLFQATGAPRPLASGRGVEQQQFGSSLSWQSAARVARGGPGGRGVGPGTRSGCNEGGLKDDARFTQHQQQHNILIPKQKQADWGAGLSNISDGSALLWPAKVPTEGGMPAAAEGQHSSTQQQHQTALMIQFAQQLAIMQQQQQSLANSAARGTSVDSLNVAANPFAGLIGSLQQGNPGLANSNLSQQQLQQQLLMMCMLHQQQQQQQAGANTPAPGLSAIDLQQLMLYTQYYSMLLSGMSEQQATATVQAQQLLQRQQDEIVKQQLLHHSIQQQQQLQLSLAGLNAAPAASFSGLSDSCKGPPPT